MKSLTFEFYGLRDFRGFGFDKLDLFLFRLRLGVFGIVGMSVILTDWAQCWHEAFKRALKGGSPWG